MDGLNGWVAESEAGIDMRTEGGRRDIDIHLTRVSSIELVTGFLVSPFELYPSQRDH
jgi:hypothetical protein